MAGKIELNLDNQQLNSFISYYKSLPSKSSTTVRFFNRGEFYTVHGTDAIETAKSVFRTTSFVKTYGSGSNTLDSLVLNKNQFANYVKDLLLIRQYRVEVYSNSSGKKSQSNWNLEFKGSPGNLSQFEEVLFNTEADQVVGSSVLSVKIDNKSKTIGLALVDNVEHKFELTEFPDDDQLSNLESIVVQFSPKEVLCSVDDSDKLKKMTDRCGVMLSTRKKSEFTVDGLVQDLNRLLKFKEGQQQNALSLSQMKLEIATAALSAAVKYLELSSDSDNFGLYKMDNLNGTRFVYIDSAAVSALSVCPVNETKGKNGPTTIVELLDKCRTAQGRRLLHNWVKQPLKDINAVNERLDIVQLFVDDQMTRQTVHDEHLRKIPDLLVLAKKLEKKKSNLSDCYRIYQAIDKMGSLIETLESAESQLTSTLNDVVSTPLKDHVRDMSKYQEMISSTLDLDLVDKGEFLVKAEFDEELQKLREELDELQDIFGTELNRVARDLSLEPKKTLKLESNNQLGYFFRVTLKDEKTIRNNKNYPQIDTNKAGVRFRSLKLSEMNDNYLSTLNQYSEHQKSIVDEVVSISSGYGTTLQQISDIVAQLDVLCSFAVVAACSATPYVRPNMLPRGDGNLKLTEARHPCVELVDNVSFIPNDVTFDSKGRFHVITGPNMGGKSTFIRSIGVVALMAHIGSFVPCSSAQIPMLDAILARVGANDSTLKGMSTFMVEMVETTGIIKMATSDSLVIIDELGRGTSTYEGCGIAWAIAQHLSVSAKCFGLFATHFHELTRLADEIEEVNNWHVAAATLDDTFTLLYKVRPGASDRSFGIHVARMSKFPDTVVEEAKRKLAELEDYQSRLDVGSDVKKRKIVEEGEQLIEETLNRCKNLQVDKMSDEDVTQLVRKIADDLRSSGNPYIETLLSAN